MDIIFKEAEGQDAAALIEFMHRVGDETDNLSFSGTTFNISVDREIRFVEKFSKHKRSIMLVAMSDGAVVANASIEGNRIERYSHRGEASIAVLKEYWGRGIGSALMRMLLDFARSSGLEILSLDVRADNERAISLYESFGFKKLGRFENYFRIGQNYYDAYIMTLSL